MLLIWNGGMWSSGSLYVEATSQNPGSSLCLGMQTPLNTIEHDELLNGHAFIQEFCSGGLGRLLAEPGVFPNLDPSPLEL